MRWIVCAFMLSLSACAGHIAPSKTTPAKTAVPVQGPVMGNADLCVAPDTIPKLKSAALAGDGKAAWTLNLGYSFCAEAIGEGEIWAHIAAQNDEHFHAPYASVLDGYPLIDAHLRALYWLNIDKPGVNTKELLTGLPAEVSAYNKSYGHFVTAQMRAEPDLGFGTTEDVQEFNARHPLGATLPQNIATTKTLWPLRVDAVLGDADAAGALAAYYDAAGQYSVFFYWKTIEAENGDARAELFLAETYAVSPLEDSRVRAKFWATRAIRDAMDPETKHLAEFAQSRMQNYLSNTPAYMPLPPE